MEIFLLLGGAGGKGREGVEGYGETQLLTNYQSIIENAFL